MADSDAEDTIDYSPCVIRTQGVPASAAAPTLAADIASLLIDHMGTVLATLLPFGLSSTDALPSPDMEADTTDEKYVSHPLVFAAALGNMLDAWRSGVEQAIPMQEFLGIVAEHLRSGMTAAALTAARASSDP